MVFWPFAWLSPRHALTLITLLVLPLIQATTGALLWNVAAEKLGHAPVSPARWSRVALGVVLPASVAWTAVRWLGMPTTSAALESVTWPGWVGMALGLLVLSLASLLATTQPRHRMALATWAAAGGVMTIACWAMIVSFQLEPGDWLEYRTLRLSVQPPSFPFVVLVHLAATVSLGSALALHANVAHARLARALANFSAAIGCTVVVAAPWWLPPQVLSQTARSFVEQGISGPAWPTRWGIITLFAWATFALAANIRPKASNGRVLLLLAALAACSSQGLWASYRGPWTVRGWLYENAVEAESLRGSRRSASMSPSMNAEAELGELVFRHRCATCHARSGPLATWRSTLGCDPVEIRKRLESLRETDRIGHPDRERMPPLVGSDRELDALATWLRNGNPCPASD
jgi:mono/diheme cytochrome c family protein